MGPTFAKKIPIFNFFEKSIFEIFAPGVSRSLQRSGGGDAEKSKIEDFFRKKSPMVPNGGKIISIGPDWLIWAASAKICENCEFGK